MGLIAGCMGDSGWGIYGDERQCLLQLCDQYGAKLLARYVQHRRLQQLISETSTLSHARRTSAPTQATLAVDPRQVLPAPRQICLIMEAASLPECDLLMALSACQLT